MTTSHAAAAEATANQGSIGTTLTSADALRVEEMRGTQSLIRLGWLLSLAFLAPLLFLDGNVLLKLVLACSIGATVLLSVWVHQANGTQQTYKQWRVTTLAIAAVITAHIGVLYVGPYSATPIVVIVGLNAYCRTESATAAALVYALAAALYLIPALLVLFGVIADPGFHSSKLGHINIVQKLVGLSYISGLYVAIWWLARSTRRASQSSIEELQKTNRLALHREVLLQELRHDLNRALEVGGPGRYSDHTLGSFRLGMVLGRGGMGEVYEGVHIDTNEHAAVKVLHPELLSDSDHVARFLREAKAVGTLTSRHVVRVFDSSPPTDPIPYLVMEHLVGETLGQMISREQYQSLEEIADMCDQIAEVLDEAKEHGIVHRDIKPQNVLFAEVGAAAPHWKVLDFGVATLAEHSGTLTQGAVIGTPAYMSPEQARGEKVDHRADLYGLAAIVYRSAVRRPPFSGKDLGPVLYRVVHDMPDRPSSVLDIPEDVDAFLAIGLAKARDDRFGSARELAVAFRAAIGGTLAPELRERAKQILVKRPYTDQALRNKRLRKVRNR